ncbi:hypothetical protein FA95DRAFT_1683227 [Auriscalpium vulgare]|uniref:Uncharacterized protein n=1 Tax=Auriscalpium vulgare TaxID=40419 RepID=A0ACB8RC10_9AGAM|nr:hypothetical protein FA95DRAFT_1683227 [Auriscalpium vulgare]
MSCPGRCACPGIPHHEEDIPAHFLRGAEIESVGHVSYHEDFYVSTSVTADTTRNQSPRSALGHGLPYTAFTFTAPTHVSTNGTFTVSFAITNTGGRDGREVDQVCVAVLVAALSSGRVCEGRARAGWRRCGQSRRASGGGRTFQPAVMRAVPLGQNSSGSTTSLVQGRHLRHLCRV